jgi:hypothetical protein
MCQIDSLEMTLTLYDIKPHPLRVVLIYYQQSLVMTFFILHIKIL